MAITKERLKLIARIWIYIARFRDLGKHPLDCDIRFSNKVIDCFYKKICIGRSSSIKFIANTGSSFSYLANEGYLFKPVRGGPDIEYCDGQGQINTLWWHFRHDRSMSQILIYLAEFARAKEGHRQGNYKNPTKRTVKHD
jgi:hypothetical protein